MPRRRSQKSLPVVGLDRLLGSVTFLPIAERELRVASRKASTFWVRVIAAFVGLLLGTGFLVMTLFPGSPFGTASLGTALFTVLTWLSLAAALSTGLFFTSDCLSEEKRDGTLGFLFLTDLRGYDIVLGKLLATSLRSFYALLAVFPILALTLFMGGVSAAQFSKTSLALINGLFFSLATGLFVSAISRHSQKALAGTLVLLVFLVAGGPAIDAILATIQSQSFVPTLSLLSPGYLFITAGSWGTGPYWQGLFANQLVAWMFLSLACWLLPRSWQERATTPSAAGRWTQWWRFGGVKRRARLRQKLVAVNPVLWLACRERWQAGTLWIVALLTAGGLIALAAAEIQSMWWFVLSYFAGALTLLLYLSTASQSSRFLLEARRSGLIELLLATPLTVKQIVRGQWRALLRMFGPPLALCLVAQFAGTVAVQHLTWSRFAAAMPPTPPAANTTNSAAALTASNTVIVTGAATTGTAPVAVGPFTPPNHLVTLVISLGGTLTTAANLVALGWFGMWVGLNSRSGNLATLKAILFVQIIPWFGVSFAAGLIVPLLLFTGLMKGTPASMPQMMVWYPLLTAGLATALYLLKDVAFSLWARRKLYSEFRERAAHAVMPIRPSLPPRLRAGVPPPLIAPISVLSTGTDGTTTALPRPERGHD